ncbi:MAG: ATP-binding protein [Thermodesulfobacteriota bacterium]
MSDDPKKTELNLLSNLANGIRTGLFVFLIGILLTYLLANAEERRFQEQLHGQIIGQLAKIRAKLEAEVNANFYLTRGMVAYVASHPDIDQGTFRHIAKVLLRHKNLVKNIALAPDNIVDFVYPLKGNKKVIGLDYRENKEQWPMVEEVIKSRQTIVAGPINLVQGGVAFICRSPIYLLSSDRLYGDDVYWGLTSIVIDKNKLFKAADFYSHDDSIRLAIRGIDGKGEQGGLIDGDPDVFQENPIVLSVSIPGGSWQLGAVPRHGWEVLSRPATFTWGGGLLVSLITALLVVFFLQRKEQVQRQIGDALTRAESAGRAKSEFLANMSHEIRTPLNSIIGRSALALDHQIDKDTRSHLEMISSSSHNLLALVNDILDFSKIEAGELTIENSPFDLHDTVQSCCRTVKILLEDKDKSVALNHTIAPDVPRVVTGDALRLRQILLNLLSNSVKFTEDGTIDLSVKCLPTDNYLQIQFQVRDTGIGIAPEKLDSIFDKFSQVDHSATRKFGGTGLGLAICHYLCQLMGGDIEVTSTPGKGSTFSCTLLFTPCSDDELISVKDPLPTEPQIVPPMSLLLVEDNEPNRILARMVLEKDNHHIEEAHDGLHALGLLAENDYDVVLMDVQMPVMDGFSATTIIRHAERGDEIKGIDEDLAAKLRIRLKGQHTPIIAMTAKAMSGDREECLAAGMDYYLSKPFTAGGVKAVLGQIASLRLIS